MLYNMKYPARSYGIFLPKIVKNDFNQDVRINWRTLRGREQTNPKCRISHSKIHYNSSTSQQCTEEKCRRRWEYSRRRDSRDIKSTVMSYRNLIWSYYKHNKCKKKKKLFLREQILNRTVDDIKELLSILLKWQCNYVRKCSYFSYFLEMYVRLI